MDQNQSEIIKIINKFINEVENLEITVKKAYLFGSYARNENKEWSDIDLAIVSDDFSGNTFDDMSRLSEAILKVNVMIEPHPFLTTKFVESNFFVREIINTGLKIR